MGAPPPVITRDQVASRILAGDSLIIIRNKVLRVPPSWLTAHPGGALAILHFVGRDATDEVEAFHSAETLARIKGFVIGTVEVGEHGWESFLPPVMSGWVRRVGVDGGKEWYREAEAFKSTVDTEQYPSSDVQLVEKTSTQEASGPTLETITAAPSPLSAKSQADHSAAYKELHQRIIDAGLYKTRYFSGYGPEIARYTLFAVVAAVAYLKDWMVISAFSLGLLWHQVTFTAHDLGHMGVTHDWVIDRVIGILVADLLVRLEVVTNHPSHDPDIQHLPFFAISPIFLNSLYSSYYKRVMRFDAVSKIFISLQHKLFYVVMSLARFNLYALSYTFLAKHAFQPKRAKGARWWWWGEIFCLGLFYCWYSALLRGIGSWPRIIVYILISHIVPSPLHVQIVLSHFSRSTADLGPGESFPHRQLRTSTDVICSPSIEWIHGGLHLQVTHHLFPRLPRHNLREASLIVKEFAKQQGLEYCEFGFFEGNSEVRGVLRQVAEQVKIVGMVADSHIREAMVS
ncbi:hypothetical protein NLI96_g9717 [Meripilus lineatus]|uniref:Delta 8-(E)-sphingolipid desaturase n=1 Tax=Meripilus lineatus TaxID=2056292 RepID=A0AAD5YEY7_9APHY|nr:hypothetical protein NLI96_g9717 [Physisporinus lineatus]